MSSEASTWFPRSLFGLTDSSTSAEVEDAKEPAIDWSQVNSANPPKMISDKSNNDSDSVNEGEVIVPFQSPSDVEYLNSVMDGQSRYESVLTSTITSALKAEKYLLGIDLSRYRSIVPTFTSALEIARYIQKTEKVSFNQSIVITKNVISQLNESPLEAIRKKKKGKSKSGKQRRMEAKLRAVVASQILANEGKQENQAEPGTRIEEILLSEAEKLGNLVPDDGDDEITEPIFHDELPPEPTFGSDDLLQFARENANPPVADEICEGCDVSIYDGGEGTIVFARTDEKLEDFIQSLDSYDEDDLDHLFIELEFEGDIGLYKLSQFRNLSLAKLLNYTPGLDNKLDIIYVPQRTMSDSQLDEIASSDTTGLRDRICALFSEKVSSLNFKSGSVCSFGVKKITVDKRSNLYVLPKLDKVKSSVLKSVLETNLKMVTYNQRTSDIADRLDFEIQIENTKSNSTAGNMTTQVATLCRKFSERFQLDLKTSVSIIGYFLGQGKGDETINYVNGFLSRFTIKDLHDFVKEVVLV